MNRNEDATARDGPRCPSCGATLYVSHVEYGGRGTEVPIRRCSRCGGIVRGEPRPRQARSNERSGRRSKAPVDEGPPANPVIDPEIARRLLGGEES